MPTLQIPKLMNGDRLTRAEFERRYSAMPDVKAELLEGIVYLSSPVHHRKHGTPHARVIGWLSYYLAFTPHLDYADNATVRLNETDEPQPDAFLRLESWVGGSSMRGEDDYLEGPPELVVEIAASSVSYDMHVKREVYRRGGVREYLVWRVDDEAFDWFVLREGRFERLEIEDGRLKSPTFPGLELDVNALFQGDMAHLLAVIQEAVAKPEHAEFVKMLEARAKG